mgnify:FL=1
MENRNTFWSNIPTVTKNLLIINLIFWLLDLVCSSRFHLHLQSILGLNYIMADSFHLWQPLTYMFMHSGFSHLFFNMFAVFMFAAPLEQQWGSKRFLVYYLISGIGAGLVQEFVWWLMYGSAPVAALTIGASGAVFGILFAFGWLFPDTKLFIFPIPVPIRARIFVIIYAVIELFAGVANFSGDNVAHFAHLGGLLFGWLLILWWKHFDKSFGATPSNFNLKQWWSRIKQKFSNRHKENNPHEGYHYQEPVSGNTDTADTREDEAEKREMDRILDKIRKSGYDSLTQEEKEKLFRKK